MDNPLVSILVPVYNVEKYIERCARSIFEQTYQNLEIIFVDDCTPDNSISVVQKVLEDYPNRKSQVRILHHDHNRGLSAARNTAIDAATGEFVMHVDSDDWIEPYSVDELVNRQRKTFKDIYPSQDRREQVLNIVCTPDHKFAMPTGVMLESLLENNVGEKIHIFVLKDETFTQKDRDNIIQVCGKFENNKVSFFNVGHLLSNYPQIGKVSPYISKATYYRLFIPTILKEEEKCLYLDGDMIVRHSLKEFYDSDIRDIALMAVPEMDESRQPYSRLGYSSKYGMFNAGMMLINIAFWRKFNAEQKFLDILYNQTYRIKAHDEDVLNIVFHKYWRRSHFKYNTLSGYLWQPKFINPTDYKRYQDEIQEASQNPCIVHFTGPFKPWQKEGAKHPYREEFVDYLQRTPWKKYDVNTICKLGLKHSIAMFLRAVGLKKQLPNQYL